MRKEVATRQRRYDQLRVHAMIKRYTTGVGAGLAGIALLAGCGNGESPGTPSTGTTSNQATPEATTEHAVPDQVIVYRPGFIDTYLTVDDVPAWPGPDPSEFLQPDPPSGMSGTLTGPEAQVAYEAALDHPDALIEEGADPDNATAAFWGFEGIVLWLVVEPQW